MIHFNQTHGSHESALNFSLTKVRALRRGRRSPDGIHGHHHHDHHRADHVDHLAESHLHPEDGFGPNGVRPPTCGGLGSGYVCCRCQWQLDSLAPDKVQVWARDQPGHPPSKPPSWLWGADRRAKGKKVVDESAEIAKGGLSGESGHRSECFRWGMKEVRWTSWEAAARELLIELRGESGTHIGRTLVTTVTLATVMEKMEAKWKKNWGLSILWEELSLVIRRPEDCEQPTNQHKGQLTCWSAEGGGHCWCRFR